MNQSISFACCTPSSAYQVQGYLPGSTRYHAVPGTVPVCTVRYQVQGYQVLTTSQSADQLATYRMKIVMNCDVMFCTILNNNPNLEKRVTDAREIQSVSLRYHEKKS